MYHHQQNNSSYDYSSYSTTPFEHGTAPPAQASGRAVRPSTSQTQSPPQQSNFQPSPSYTSSTTYPSAPYGISSAHAQQWQQESWAPQQYAQPFTSQSMQTEMTYTSPAARPDGPHPASTPDARGFPPSNLPPPHEPRRQDSGYSQSLPASSHNATPPRTRRREKDSPAIAPAAAPGSSGPDFAKVIINRTCPVLVLFSDNLFFPQMQDSYRLIMDNANNMMTSGTLSATRSPAAETIERMWQSANYSAQMLQSTVPQPIPEGRPTTTAGEKDGPSSKRQVSAADANL